MVDLGKSFPSQFLSNNMMSKERRIPLYLEKIFSSILGDCNFVPQARSDISAQLASFNVKKGKIHLTHLLPVFAAYFSSYCISYFEQKFDVNLPCHTCFMSGYLKRNISFIYATINLEIVINCP